MELFTIKGLKAGPTFLFNDQAPFADVIKAVEEELARAKGFFRASPVVLHFGERLLNKDEWWTLKDILHREGLLLRYAVTTAAHLPPIAVHHLESPAPTIAAICRSPIR